MIALVVTAPFASATYNIQISPPFQGVAPLLYTTVATTGCHSRGDFPLPPSVNPTRGTVRERLQASSAFCPGGTVHDDYAEVVSSPGFYGPNFTVPFAGPYNATFEWVFAYNVSLNASGPGSSASALVSIFVEGFLYDGTNMTTLSGTGGDTFALIHEIHNGTWSEGTRYLLVKVVNSFTLAPGQVYYFETVLTTSAEGVADGAGSASATLDLGDHVDHARLIDLGLVST